MTNEQTWAFYTLVPQLIADGLIEPGIGVAEHEIGQAILDQAAEDGVNIDAEAHHDATCESCKAADLLGE